MELTQENITKIHRQKESTIILLTDRSLTIEDPQSKIYDSLFSVDINTINNIISKNNFKTQLTPKENENVKK